jgi:hypothetical protein
VRSDEGYTVVERKNWGKYPLLSLIKSGSDMDGDGAFFIPEDEVAANPDTKLIQMEALTRDGEWITITGGPGGTFPSRGWARAGISWYRWESLSRIDLDDHMDFRVTVPSDVLDNNPKISTIAFQPQQEFYDIELAVLLPRLRLDPELETLDLLETPVMLYLDDEPILDIDVTSMLGTGPNDGELCTWGNAEEIGGRCDIQGGWLHVNAPEIRDELRWIGLEVDLPALARQCLNEALTEWDPDEEDVVELTSPYLGAEDLN